LPGVGGEHLDYWEGFLLGPLWSDTDYENRRHGGLILGIGVVVWAAIAVIVLLPGTQSVWISPASLRMSMLFYVGLTLVSPFLSRIYYRLAFPLRIVALGIQLAKFCAGMMVPVNILLKGFRLDLPSLQDEALVFFNEYLSGIIDRFTGDYGGAGMIIGIGVGGVSIALMGAGIALASLIAPRVILAAMRIIQWIYDSLLFRLVFRRWGFG